jgi:anti-anti-sigma factor
MKLSASRWKSWDIIKIEDEFVVKHLVEIRRFLDGFEKAETRCIAFDLSMTSYIDSSAITLLLNFQKRLLMTNGTVVIFGASEDTRSIFNIVGLDSSIPTYDTREQFESSVPV